MKTYTFVVSLQTPITIKKIGDATWRGNINRIKWDQAESVATEVSALIASCFPKAKVEVDCEFSADGTQLLSGLVIQVVSEQEIELEPVLIGFLSQITSSLGDQDLFFGLEEPLRLLITKHIDCFLDQFGNTKVRVPLAVKGKGLEFRISGKFSAPPRELPQMHSSFTFRARINGFMKRERTLSLCSEVDSTIVNTTFDLNEFMHNIAQAVLDDTVHEFTIQPKENEKGELRNTLISMSSALTLETLC